MFRTLALTAALSLTACPPRAPPSDIAIEYNQRCAAALTAGQLDEAEALCAYMPPSGFQRTRPPANGKKSKHGVRNLLPPAAP